MAYFGEFPQPPYEVNAAPFEALVTTGAISGWREFNKFAKSSVISTSTVDIWPNNSILSYLSSAETMHISSTDADDTVEGNGAQVVKVFGLDANYDEIEESVNTNGTGNSTTTQAFLRVYRMKTTRAGSSGFNEGTITATSSSSGTVQSYMVAQKNGTLQSQYTVPNGFYYVLSELEITVQKGDQAVVELYARPFGEVFQLNRSYNVFEQSIGFQISPPLLYAPKTDITLRAIKITGAGDVDVSANYDGYLVQSSEVTP